MGAVEPRRSNCYLLAERGIFALLSQSTAFRVVKSCRCAGQFCVKKAPYLSVASHVNSVLGVQCEGLLWRAYTLGYSN